MQSYANLANNLAAIEKLGEMIAASGMFGSMTKSQGFVIACHCYTTETPLLEYQRKNMLLGNRPGIPYDAMVAAFQSAGGKIKVVEKSPDAARLVLIYDGTETPFELTWEQAKNEPFVYSPKMKEAEIVAMLRGGNQVAIEKATKAKYATPRSRAVMLWARCISDAIRTVCPAANFGLYTPEEIDDIPDSDKTPGQSSTQPAPATAAAPTATPAITTPPVAKPAETTAPAATTPPTSPPPTEPATQSPPKAASPPTTPPVSPPLADANAFPPGDDSGQSMETDSPATKEQREKVIALLAELQATDSTIGARIKAKIDSAGIAGGILGLTFAEAESLIDSLKTKAIEAFFDADLKGHASGKK